MKTSLLAIVGSPRKGKATDQLVDKAIEGFESRSSNHELKKLNLIDYDIKHCRNCLKCRDSLIQGPVARCSIEDDMMYISKDVLDSDCLIIGTPVHMGYATAITMSFLERICWTFGKPEGKFLTLSGIPVPRSDKKRKAVTIVTSGIVPPIFRKLADHATPLIKSTIRDSLRAGIVGGMYAGALETRGVRYYFDKAFKLGGRLARKTEANG